MLTNDELAPGERYETPQDIPLIWGIDDMIKACDGYIQVYDSRDVLWEVRTQLVANFHFIDSESREPCGATLITIKRPATIEATHPG